MTEIYFCHFFTLASAPMEKKALATTAPPIILFYFPLFAFIFMYFYLVFLSYFIHFRTHGEERARHNRAADLRAMPDQQSALDSEKNRGR